MGRGWSTTSVGPPALPDSHPAAAAQNRSSEFNPEFVHIKGWSFYGEECTQFLFGEKSNIPFRVLWVLAIPLGTLPIVDLGSLWLVADTLNAMMAIPNLIALLLLSPVVFKLTRDYFNDPANRLEDS